MDEVARHALSQGQHHSDAATTLLTSSHKTQVLGPCPSCDSDLKCCNDSALLWMHWLISASNLMMESEMSVGKALSLHPIQICNGKYSKSAFQVLLHIQYLSAVKNPHITD